MADPAQPVWARTPEKKRTTLTREAIVAAAIAVADAEGLGAVSIRRVAAELDARTMSLYSHIDSKEDLLDLMADEVTAEVLIEGDLPADWREAISLIVRRSRDHVLRHPWMVEVASSRPRIGPNALRHVEQSLAAVKPLGLDARASARIVVAIDDYMLGYVIRESMDRTGERDAARREAMKPYLEGLVGSGEFPNLARLLAEGGPQTDVTFEQGLAWLLDGITRDL